MNWYGNPVDLNGDGTAEPEIADELTGRASATVLFYLMKYSNIFKITVITVR